MAAEYSVPKKTLSTWVESKEKLLHSLEQESNIKRQEMITGNS